MDLQRQQMILHSHSYCPGRHKEAEAVRYLLRTGHLNISVDTRTILKVAMNGTFNNEIRAGNPNDAHLTGYVNSGLNMASNLEWLRMNNIISQDAPSYWPYNQSMPPIGPPGVAIFPTPYGLAPVYTASPILSQYEHLQPRYINPSASSNAKKPESCNTNIQISLQCMNQNNPVKINTWNDMSLKMPVELDSASKHDLPNGCAPTQNACIENGGTDEPTMAKEISKDTGNLLPQDKFVEFTRLAMKGCELAEKLAFRNRTRPCFKKIDNLCARIKQDLVRPDGVVLNVNSQGIAWVVKDFIFVFTRIVNAWIIIKAYVYNTAEGLNGVKSSLSPEFTNSFAIWQESTMVFLENIIKSFLNLDLLEKYNFNKGNGSNNPNSENDKTIDKLLDDPYEFLSESFADEENMNDSNISALQKKYYSTLIEESEESQREATANGTYFKTGVYNPLKKESNSSIDVTAANKVENIKSDDNDNTPKTINPTIGNDNKMCNSPLFSLKMNGSTSTPKQPTPSAQRIEAASDKRNAVPNESVGPNQIKDKPAIYRSPFDIPTFDHQPINPPAPGFDPTIVRSQNSDFNVKLEELLQRIVKIPALEYFFYAQFTKNYFPDFMAKHSDWMDVRSIILKAKSGGYLYIFEIIHDIMIIIHRVKLYLKTNHNELLSKSISEYEKGVESILSDKLFQNWQIDHIVEYIRETNKFSCG